MCSPIPSARWRRAQGVQDREGWLGRPMQRTEDLLLSTTCNGPLRPVGLLLCVGGGVQGAETQPAFLPGRTLIIPAWCPPLPPRLPAIRTSHLLPAVFVRAALRRRRLRRRRRFQARVPSLLLGDMTCLDRFRLDRAAIQALCEELAPALQGQAAAPRGIPVLQRVLLSLRYLATGSFQGVMAEALEVSQSSASRCLHAFLDALVGRIREHIHFPTSEAELAPIRAGFSSFAGFPNVIGAVDCTHVAICAPREEPQVYRNRHRFYSINVQAACDHQGIFTDLVAKFPGSVHDAQIFTTSGLNRLLSSWPEGRGWLLGDRGYPLLPYLLTPYPADEPADRANYNQAHRRTRMVIERAFGQLKMRFRCLHHTGGRLAMQPFTVAKLVAACVMLHNIAVRQQLPLPATEGPGEDPWLPPAGRLSPDAPAEPQEHDRAVRDRVAEHLWHAAR